MHSNFQLGEYYGYSIVAADLTGDGFDELLVGAPMYSTANDPEVGRVFVYRNSGVSRERERRHVLVALIITLLFDTSDKKQYTIISWPISLGQSVFCDTFSWYFRVWKIWSCYYQLGRYQ